MERVADALSSDIVIKSTIEELVNVLETANVQPAADAVDASKASKEPVADAVDASKASKETAADAVDTSKERDKSPIRRKDTSSRNALRLQVDDDEIISQLFLTSSTIDRDKKAFGNKRYMDGFMEAQQLERDEILSAIEQVRQLCVNTHTELLSKPVLERTCHSAGNATMDEPTRFVRRALARVPAASVDVIDEPRQCCCATDSGHGDGVNEPRQ